MKKLLNQLFSRLKDGSFQTGIRSLVQMIHRFLASLSTDPKTRYLTLLWCGVILFLSIQNLAGIPPFRMLMPGSIIPFPVRDQRESIQIAAVSRDSGKEVVIRSRILIDGEDLDGNIQRLLFEISSPQIDTAAPSQREGEEEPIGATNLMRFPRFGYALRKSWYRNDKGEQQLILDFRKSTIDAELKRYLEERASDPDFRKFDFLSLYFASLTHSIFLAKLPIKSLIYLVDGERPLETNKTFDLSGEHRASDYR